jgi:hypothetical protein
MGSIFLDSTKADFGRYKQIPVKIDTQHWTLSSASAEYLLVAVSSQDTALTYPLVDGYYSK